MTKPIHITVAPNGARLQKSDHPALPITVAEMVKTALACHKAGADALHLHARQSDGRHSLDVAFYQAAIDQIAAQTPDMDIQITTESAGIFEVSDQLNVLEALKPSAASIAVREIARSPALAPKVYQFAQSSGTRVQHILYGPACFVQLADWHAAGVIPRDMSDAIVVLGQYAPPRDGQPDELPALLELAKGQNLRLTVCAFGVQEQACLLAAAKAGCALRVGFENNRTAPDGSIWPDNAAAVAGLRSALLEQM